VSAPVEVRQEDVVQAALAKADTEFQELFGPPNSWSQLVVGAYQLDQHIARQRATNWGEAA
jgi:hypothetical protein